MNRSPESSITWYATANGTAHLIPAGLTRDAVPLFTVTTFDKEERLLDFSRPMPLPEAEHYARSLKA